MSKVNDRLFWTKAAIQTIPHAGNLPAELAIRHLCGEKELPAFSPVTSSSIGSVLSSSPFLRTSLFSRLRITKMRQNSKKFLFSIYCKFFLFFGCRASTCCYLAQNTVGSSTHMLITTFICYFKVELISVYPALNIMA
jgi:hypothetical protein